jgi:protocatechuate 3,4-dioxygenase beta subunit
MTTHGIGVRVVLLALALLVTPQAQAQRGDSGSITGYVLDQGGNPLAGVKITAASSTQIGGQRVAYTKADGSFRFPVLDPGVFQVKAESPRLTTAVQTGVKVGLNAPSEVSFVMEVATSKVEEVRIVERPPLVSTTSASVKEVYDIDFVDSLPHDSRNAVFNQIANYTAGTIRSGRMRGGGSAQTLLTMDGFNMLRQFPTLKSTAAYEIQSAATGPTT